AGDVPRGSILDQVTQRQNRLSFLLGSSRRWGIFTLAGAFGLEYELNDDRRCIVRAGTIFVSSTDPEFCDDDGLLLASGGPLDAVVAPDAYNIFDALHPSYIAFRFSLGVTFDDL